MVLISATAFGTLSILAKLAYSAGLGTNQLLAFRFVVASAGMWAVACAVGQSPLRLQRRQVINLVALGAVVYTAQALTYFLALRSLPASLCVLIVYIYPSLVVLAGWLLLGRAVSPWHIVALVASFAGVALLVGGAQFQLAWALVLLFAAPVLYTTFIFLGERVMADAPAVAACAVMFSSTAVVFCVIAGLEGQLALPATTAGWLVGFAIAVIPTMVAISLFLAGLPRIGASRAALLSTVEPVVTVLLAVVLLGDRLSALQVVGGGLVLVAVIVVQAAHLWRPGPQTALR
jgi:drug/metabolite transporter (DMT)-like permease